MTVWEAGAATLRGGPAAEWCTYTPAPAGPAVVIPMVFEVSDPTFSVGAIEGRSAGAFAVLWRSDVPTRPGEGDTILRQATGETYRLEQAAFEDIESTRWRVDLGHAL